MVVHPHVRINRYELILIVRLQQTNSIFLSEKEENPPINCYQQPMHRQIIITDMSTAIKATVVHI